MKITKEISLDRFDAWCGAEKTLDKIISEGKAEALEFILVHNTEIQNSFSKSEISFWFLTSIFWFGNFILI